MKEIDLHGTRHKDVPDQLIQAIVYDPTPFVVITGQSSEMKRIVVETVSKFKLTAREDIGNPGRMIVDENR
jgi:hypothetical protein